MEPTAQPQFDDEHMARATIRGLSILMVHTVLELTLFALVCFLGTTLVILALQRL